MKTLVTGGGGFLGRSIVEQLLARRDEVTVFARGSYPELAAMGARTLNGDLQDAGAAAEACRGMDVVFHIAAKAGHWGPWAEYYGANVTGTANIISGCRTHGVPRLVYCSSPSVIFDGLMQEGVDELYPYPAAYESPYPHTKALAEQMVIKANSPELLTVSLRPHLIFGPRDRHLLPAVLRVARKGFFPHVGDGTNRVDLTFVEDAARAHLLAAGRLVPGSPVPGSVYFISQDEPVSLWPWLNALLSRLDYPPIRLHLSLPMARTLGAGLEFLYRRLSLKGEPRLTRFLASELAQSHWYDISRAKRDLGYRPQFTMAEALEITLPSLL
jgi:nucleoside-diphosphate-sugar epimerase